MSMLRCTAVIGFSLCAAAQALANPCTVYHAGGRSVIHDARPSRVAIAEERIRFRLEIDAGGGGGTPGIARVRTAVHYRLRNRGPAINAVVGFPIGLPGEVVGEGDRPAERFDFRVRGQGVAERYHPSLAEALRWSRRRGVLSFCEDAALPKRARGADRVKDEFGDRRFRIARDHLVDMESDFAVHWFFWRQKFARGDTELKVEYTTHTANPCRFNYVLRTARFWHGGRIGQLEVVVEQTGKSQPGPVELALVPLVTARELKRGRRPVLQAGRRREHATVAPKTVDKPPGHRTVWQWRRFAPKADVQLILAACREPPTG